ncbi:apolipoprotein A-I [Clupea harengus]|uniref:Apolipoprotein A-I n=1 Tax=Clupea harengus TaxID=7950 RepID=A0A6P8G0R7_CLUHA|nr:apolipoprotein A-I [Clupea harengus]
MRFVTCALALLLVASTQTGSIQAHAPWPLEDYRIAAMTLLGTIKDATLTAVSNYGFNTMAISKTLDQIEEHIQVSYAVVSPYFNNFISNAIEATSGLRETLVADVEALFNDLRPRGEELRQVLGKHLHEYHEKLEPVMQEFNPMYN